MMMLICASSVNKSFCFAIWFRDLQLVYDCNLEWDILLMNGILLHGSVENSVCLKKKKHMLIFFFIKAFSFKDKQDRTEMLLKVL